DLDLVDATKKEFNLKKTYYSRNFKNIHLVALDSNLLNDDANKAEMLNWLRTDLSKLKKSQVSVVYFFHSPVTSASLHKPSETSLREITPILDEYLVDFVITAENHNYQRSCPLNLTGISEVCTSPGSLYIVSGGGGAPLQGFTGTREEIIRQRVKAYHFVLIEVDGQNIHLRAIDTEGKTIDDIELKKKI
ncbi:hypothetical protein KC644_03005, partial [Candidatus Berkelbacteria bacterium]|nr:hypothetical protein [Candidatus Berkelbacteria bacterium]